MDRCSVLAMLYQRLKGQNQGERSEFLIGVEICTAQARSVPVWSGALHGDLLEALLQLQLPSMASIQWLSLRKMGCSMESLCWVRGWWCQDWPGAVIARCWLCGGRR